MRTDKNGYYYYSIRTKDAAFDEWLREQAAKNDCSINTYVKMVLNKERNENKHIRSGKSDR